ncbi:hypothetical protein, partial [Bacteroides sp. 51]|uniref:hypothetical protein n=1 Tax=Bacteroides sp. 51 TaxID=2302938 RepID=UPI0013D6D00D
TKSINAWRRIAAIVKSIHQSIAIHTTHFGVEAIELLPRREDYSSSDLGRASRGRDMKAAS